MSSVDTKEQIVEAFFQVAKTKNIDKITVKDVVKECGISRQSFYYHFQDILEISEWSLEQRMKAVLDKSLNTLTVQEAIILLIQEFKSTKAAIRKIRSSDKRESLERIFIKTIRLYLEKLNQKRPNEQLINPKELDFTLEFYAIALTEYMIMNIDQEMEEEVLEKQLFKILSGQNKLFAGE